MRFWMWIYVPKSKRENNIYLTFNMYAISEAYFEKWGTAYMAVQFFGCYNIKFFFFSYSETCQVWNMSLYVSDTWYMLYYKRNCVSLQYWKKDETAVQSSCAFLTCNAQVMLIKFSRNFTFPQVTISTTFERLTQCHFSNKKRETFHVP